MATAESDKEEESYKKLFGKLSLDRSGQELTDFTLRCHGVNVKAHRILISMQSEVLRAACTRDLREERTGIYETDDDELPISRKLVDYFYKLNYEDDDADTVGDPLMNAKVFSLAEKYEVPGLAKIACDNYAARLIEWDSTEAFLETSDEVYNGTAPTVSALRDVAVTYARRLMHSKLQDDSEARARFEQVLAHIPDFAKDMAMFCLLTPSLGTCDHCRPNRKVEVLQGRCRDCGKGGTKDHC